MAQDRGYMHVFRLGSQSVNYANRIIMQNDHHRQQQQSSELSYQLMRNMSLSSISDVDTISSDEILNYRKYSTSSMPSSSDYDTYRRVYSTQSADLMRWGENWTLLRLLSEQHTTAWPKFYCCILHFYIFRFDDVSSGYSSPGSPVFVRKAESGRSMDNLEVSIIHFQ